jgi:transcriptional regulator with XRE-family HTH domain
MNASLLIRHARGLAGLSQRQLAARAGTSSATLSRYESGAISPTVATLNRLLASCLPRRRRWPDLDQFASAVGEELKTDGSEAAWRLVGEVIDDQVAADERETRLFADRRPTEIGHPGVDALVSALAEYICLQKGVSPPPWTQEPREAVPWWFVSDRPAFRAMAFRESPPSFARRGIFVTLGGLERA